MPVVYIFIGGFIPFAHSSQSGDSSAHLGQSTRSLAIFSHLSLHLALYLLQQTLLIALLRLHSRPPNAQPLLLIRLRNQMKVHMINLLVRNAPVILQHVVVVEVLRNCDFLGDVQHFEELVVGDVVELCAVVFGDDELQGC